MASSVIFVTPVCPSFGYTGLSMRAAATLQLLSDRGYAVHLLVIPPYPSEQIPASEITNLCKSWQIINNPNPMPSSILVEQETHFDWQRLLSFLGLNAPEECLRYNGHWQDTITKAIEALNPDLVIAFRFYIALFILSAVKSRVPIWLDIDEVESNSRARLSSLYKLIGNQQKELELSMQMQSYQILEKRYLSFFERIFASSNKEVGSVLSICPDAKAYIMPNTYPVVCPQQPRQANGITKLLFVGTFGHYPNRDAIDYFCANILPLIQNYSKQLVEVDVIGIGLGASGKQPNLPQVNFIGQVAATTPFYANCDIAIVPLRSASGTRIKILEAFSHQRAVISTEIGAEGLEVIPGIHLGIASSPEIFAKLCLELIDNPEQCQALSKNGHEFFKENHTLSGIESRFPHLFSLAN
jgi:glycosyltransferase involved in cell wall biosynthesis